MASTLSEAGDLTIDAKTITAMVSHAFSDDQLRRSVADQIAERIIAERWPEISAQITNDELLLTLRASIGAYVVQKLMGSR